MYPQKCHIADRSWISDEIDKTHRKYHKKICAQYSEGYSNIMGDKDDYETAQDARTRSNLWLLKRIKQINGR